jgi:hypothetical protein
MMSALFPNDIVGRKNCIKGSHQVSISVALPNSSPRHVWIENGKANILSSSKTISVQWNLGTHLGWFWSLILLLVLRERESLPILIKLLCACFALTQVRDMRARKVKGPALRSHERERELNSALSSALSSFLSSCFENESGWQIMKVTGVFVGERDSGY